MIESDRYINREVSWLSFGERILEEAMDPSLPLLEKLRFLSIFSASLDEFAMIRVAGLKKLLQDGFAKCESPDQKDLDEVLGEVTKKAKALKEKQMRFFHESLQKELNQHGIIIASYKSANQEEKHKLKALFKKDIFPVLTPLAVEPTHPYPFLNNTSIYLVVEFKEKEQISASQAMLGFVEIPANLPRLIEIKDTDRLSHFILLEDLIMHNLDDLFFGLQIANCHQMRVIRNADYYLLENSVVDLLTSIQEEISKKEAKEIVWIEISKSVSPMLKAELGKIFNISDQNFFIIDSPFDVPGLMALYKLPYKHLKEESFNPRFSLKFQTSESIFSLIARGDFLVHHPYESFYTVIEFLTSAACDADVLAIKQTLYRISGDAPIMEALIQAAKNGKQVTAVLELKARFDEQNNIAWARRLERAGINVVFGFVGLKTHAKMTLVVRKEKDKLIQYGHLSTGNYNATTAKMYTDIGFFTKDPKITKEVAALFNLLTGLNLFAWKQDELKQNPPFAHLVVAPLFLREKICQLIDEVCQDHAHGQNGLIIAKINGLVDKAIIDKLYEASCLGVKIRLLVRGVCALRPGVAGLSQNIEVRSLVDGFLEHSRIYCFQNGQKRRVFLGSADWMSRSMDRRVEIMFPIQDEACKNYLIDEILAIYWRDNTKVRILTADGSYIQIMPKPDEIPFRVQKYFINKVREEGIESIPYESAIRFDSKNGEIRPIAANQSQKQMSQKKE